MKTRQALIVFFVLCKMIGNSFAEDSLQINSYTNEKYLQTFSPRKEQEVKGIISKHYTLAPVKNIEDTIFNEESLNKYLKKLDPYSKYISPEQGAFIKKRQQRNRIGVGFNLLFSNNKVLVVPIKNAALYKVGMRVPRYLKSLNKKEIKYDDYSTYSFMNNIVLGEELMVEVDDDKHDWIIRYRPHIETFYRELVEYQEYKNLAVITLYEFRHDMQDKLIQLLQKSQRKSALIIDLRYNPGGDLYAGINMLSLFIEEGKELAYLEKENAGSGELILLESKKVSDSLYNKPIYLLASQFTSSTAEIFIRAIKYHVGNSYVFGEATKGKCLAQETHEMLDHSAVSISSYKILAPDKNDCEQMPIQPDHYIPNVELLTLDQVIKQLPSTFIGGN